MPIVAEMQESTEHIYPSIQTLPNNSPNTVSHVLSNNTFSISAF